MIQQRYIDVLKEQRKKLLEEKQKQNFISRLFFRKYTDWLVTSETKEMVVAMYYAGVKINEGNPYTKQLKLRMRLKDMNIEYHWFGNF
jgi:hypothetical protein